jgi:mannose-1-phosphate guanylyltransferase
MAGDAKVRALLMAAGLGLRLRPLTDVTPKCLIEIAGKSLLDYWVENLAACRVRNAVINTHHLALTVRRRIAEIQRAGQVNLMEAFEPELLGSAGTVTRNRALAEGAEHIIIAYTDNLSSVDLHSFLGFHRRQGAAFSMLLFHTDTPHRAGICALDAAHTVTAFVEKPELPRGNLANAGVYVARADIFRWIADLRARDIGFDVLPRLVGMTKGYVLEGYHRDIGTHESLERARRDAASGAFVARSGKRAAS